MYSHSEDFSNPEEVLKVETLNEEVRFSVFNRRTSMILQAGQCLGKEDLLLMNMDRRRKFTAKSLTRCRFLFLHHDHYMQYLGNRILSRILPQLSSLGGNGKTQEPYKLLQAVEKRQLVRYPLW
jgi:hypothetical protein